MSSSETSSPRSAKTSAAAARIRCAVALGVGAQGASACGSIGSTVPNGGAISTWMLPSGKLRPYLHFRTGRTACVPNNPHHERRWLILALIGLAQLMVVLDLDDREHRAAERAGRTSASPTTHASGSSPPTRWRSARCCCSADARRPVRAQVGVHRRPARLRRRLGHRRRGGAPSACSSARARCRASSARCSRRPRSRCSRTTFTDPPSAARRSASSARSPAAAPAIGLLLGGILTEALSWRWCLYVNLLIAIPPRSAALRLLDNARAAEPPAAGPPGHADRQPRPVRARLRVLELRDALVGRTR